MGDVIPFRRLAAASAPRRHTVMDVPDQDLVVAYRSFRDVESDYESPAESRLRATIEIEMKRRNLDPAMPLATGPAF